MSEGAFFFDSSGIVKSYANETGTQRVLSVTNPSANNTIFISKITPVEVISTFSRKFRLEEVSPSDYEMMVTDFERDCFTQYIQVEPNDEVISLAKELVSKRALRAYDALQLASAIILDKDRKKAKLDPLTFVSADNSLNDAAELEGLKIDNPNSHA